MGKLQRYLETLDKHKARLFLERSLFPVLIRRLRQLFKAIKHRGFHITAKYYFKVIASRIAQNVPFMKTLVSKLKNNRKSVLTLAKSRSVDNEVKRKLVCASKNDFIIICNSFPGAGSQYGGEFIRSRYRAYLKQGLTGSVIQISNKQVENEIELFEDTNHDIFRLSDSNLNSVLNILSDGSAKILAHSPTPHAQDRMRQKIPLNRLNYWFHGFEVRDYRRLYFNFTTESLAIQKARLNKITQERVAANRVSFQEKEISKVFVSDFLMDIAQRDNQVKIENGHVIPNFIDGDIFQYTPKTVSHMKRVLMIRCFDRRNYANDIAIEAIKLLSKRANFKDILFTIHGFGEEFASLTNPLREYPNISIEEKYSSVSEMKKLHQEHGIFLFPSRFDTQGVTMGEAMASGLVCIVNYVTGIPEYIDDSSGILVPGENSAAFADAIWQATENPKDMIKISEVAARRVREQCGLSTTIEQEIKLSELSRS